MSSNVTLQGKTISLVNKFPNKGDTAPQFRLVAGDLTDVSLNMFKGKRKILNIFPCIDTSVCALSVKKFSTVKDVDNMVMLCISCDLPFTQSRFCCEENINNVIMLSAMRGSTFGHDYGVQIINGPLEGITARAIIVLDEHDVVIYSELVKEITNEPHYERAISSLRELSAN